MDTETHKYVAAALFEDVTQGRQPSHRALQAILGGKRRHAKLYSGARGVDSPQQNVQYPFLVHSNASQPNPISCLETRKGLNEGPCLVAQHDLLIMSHKTLGATDNVTLPRPADTL